MKLHDQDAYLTCFEQVIRMTAGNKIVNGDYTTKIFNGAVSPYFRSLKQRQEIDYALKVSLRRKAAKEKKKYILNIINEYEVDNLSKKPIKSYFKVAQFLLDTCLKDSYICDLVFGCKQIELTPELV